MKKKEKLLGKEKARENLSKVKVVKDLCKKIFDAFECPGIDGSVEGPEISKLIDELAPWWEAAYKKEKEGFSAFYESIEVAFAIGFCVGQSLDVPEINTTPVLDFLRENKSVLYLPHKKAA